MSNNASSPLPMTRRRFIYTSALAAGATVITGPLFAASPRRLSANDKLNIGVVGAGGSKAESDTEHCSGENIVALCEMDSNTLVKDQAKYPNAKTYKDFRQMIEK